MRRNMRPPQDDPADYELCGSVRLGASGDAMLRDVPGQRAQRAEDADVVLVIGAQLKTVALGNFQRKLQRVDRVQPRPVLNSGASGSMSAGATPSRLSAVTMSSASSRSAGDWLADMKRGRQRAANRKAQSVSSASARRMPRAPYKKRRNSALASRRPLRRSAENDQRRPGAGPFPRRTRPGRVSRPRSAAGRLLCVHPRRPAHAAARRR